MAKYSMFDAVLLAGGRSFRFGRDKAFVEWQGMPLYVAQLRKLVGLKPQRIYLSSRADQAFPEFLEGVTRLVDDVSDLGPVGGIQQALAASEADKVLVVAVDLPRMETQFLAELIENSLPGIGRVPRSSRGWEPLAAVYPRIAMLRLVDEAIRAGDYRLQNLLMRASEQGIIEDVTISDTQRDLFANLNTPEDLREIQRGIHDENFALHRYRRGGGFTRVLDIVATEAPLEIRVNGTSVAVTMRTPGHDEDLVTGFLFTEGIIKDAAEITEIVRCPSVDESASGNVLDVRLRREVDLNRLTRHLFTSSSCGICSKATLDAVFGHYPPVDASILLTADRLLALPDVLRSVQATFERTGGLHASALFDSEGDRLLLVREDVGRHNALDKVIGQALLTDQPLSQTALLVSGRISLELMQKALAARIPFVAGISAPSSLAVDLARRSGQTLVGFLRGERFNLYAGKMPGM